MLPKNIIVSNSAVLIHNCTGRKKKSRPENWHQTDNLLPSASEQSLASQWAPAKAIRRLKIASTNNSFQGWQVGDKSRNKLLDSPTADLIIVFQLVLTSCLKHWLPCKQPSGRQLQHRCCWPSLQHTPARPQQLCTEMLPIVLLSLHHLPARPSPFSGLPSEQCPKANWDGVNSTSGLSLAADHGMRILEAPGVLWRHCRIWCSLWPPGSLQKEKIPI